MSRTINHHELPVVSRHDLVMTLLEGPDPFNGHCTCDRWSYRTADWADLGMKWAWHYVAESDGPDGHPLVRSTVKAELQAHGEYGGDCAGCGYPVVTGRTYCLTCEQDGAAAGYDHGDNCERPCCWEDTVARRVARDAAHQRVACRNCGNCLRCDEPGSPDHEDCICPAGQELPVEVAA